MQDGQLCLLSPGEGGGHCQIVKRGRKNKRKKLVGLSVGRPGWRRGKGAREHCSFYVHIIKELNGSCKQMVEIFHESPDCYSILF